MTSKKSDAKDVKNAKTAKTAKNAKIKKADAKKTVKFSAEIDGETVTAKTSKKCVGKQVADSKKCVACKKASENLFKICAAKTEPAKPAKKESKPRVNRPFGLVVEKLNNGVSRADVVKYLVENNGMKAGSAKSFVSSIGCCLNAFSGKSRKKDGVVAKYAEWLKNDKKGEEPTGDKCSIGYVKNVWNVIAA